MDRARFWHRGYPRARLILRCAEREFGISKNKGTSYWNFVPNSELSRLFCFYRHGTSIVAIVVNLVGPATVASLSHWASTFVCNTMSLTQRVARVRLRQLRLVTAIFTWTSVSQSPLDSLPPSVPKEDRWRSLAGCSSCYPTKALQATQSNKSNPRKSSTF